MAEAQMQVRKSRNITWISVLDKMIAKDFLKTMLSVWLVIVVIIVSRKFIKILDKAIEGQISNDTLLTILSLKTVVTSISLLPAATFMALLMVLGRLYKDQEMSAIAVAGGGAKTLYKAIYLITLPLSLLTLAASLYVAPWAELKSQRLLHQDEQTSDIRSLAAGKFSEYSRGDLVFYIEAVTSDKKMHSVFVQDRKKGKLNIINAERSHYQDLPGGLYMVFENGENVQGEPGSLNFTIEKFKEYAVRIQERTLSTWLSPTALETSKLWNSKEKREIAELQGRFDKPLAIILLSFLALPLATISPRGGVYGSIMFGFLIYFSYGNLTSVMQSKMIKGSLNEWPGIFWVHFLFFLVGLGLLARWYGYQWVMDNIRKRFAK